jgi:hypothetical protein
MFTKFSGYRGFDIRAGAVQLTDAERYVSALTITKHHGEQSVDKTFSTGYFKNAKDAMNSATAFARAVIDGKVAGVTINDM